MIVSNNLHSYELIMSMFGLIEIDCKYYDSDKKYEMKYDILPISSSSTRKLSKPVAHLIGILTETRIWISNPI